MSGGDRKKGRENKKPKQADAKAAPKSAYKSDRGEAAVNPFTKIRKK